MSALKKATVYLDPALHKALKLKAAETDQSLSDVLNESIKIALLEDSEDLKSIKDRKKEPTISFEKLLEKLKSDGRI